MKKELIELTQCPICGDELTLVQDVTWKEASDGTEDAWEGFLECEVNGHKFPIIKGILVLVENFSQYISNKKNIFEKLVGEDISSEMRDYILDRAVFVDQWKSDPWENLASIYTWVHYDDIAKENLLKNAMKSIGINDVSAFSPQHLYSEMIKMIPKGTNLTSPALDVGCSVGRMTHELAARSTFTVGTDYSFEAVRIAREITKEGGVYDYSLPVEGKREVKRKINAIDIVKKNVDFIVSDAQSLPFPSDFFGLVLSMNLLDVVPYPIVYLQEIQRTLRKGGCFLTCDPYNWSRVSSANVANWIGGKECGPYGGESSKVLRNVLTNQLNFKIESEKDLIPWLLRFDQRYSSIWLVDCLRAIKLEKTSSTTIQRK